MKNRDNLEKDEFKVYYQKNMDWVYFCTRYDIMEIGMIIDRLTILRTDKPIKVEKNDIVLEILNGSEYHAWCFRNKHCLKKGSGYDYIGNYIKSKQKREGLN